MKVYFRVGGTELEGEARDLSIMGAFVACSDPVSEGSVDLVLDSNGDSFSISAEVLRSNSEGFAVAFGILNPETANRLREFVHPDEENSSEPKEDLPPIERSPAIELQPDDWQPPVNEPVLHQWKPDEDLVPPPSSSPEDSSWENFPTISPPTEETVPPRGQTEPEGQVEVAEHPAPSVEAGETGHPQVVDEAAQATQTAQTPLERSISAQTSIESTQQAQTGGPGMAENAAPETDAPKGAERRESERSDQSIPIAFDNLTTLIKEFTHNISFGGLFVYTNQKLEQDEETAVTLIHPVHGERLTLLAKVVHSSDASSPDPITGNPRYGVGIQFRLPLEELKRLLSDFIGSHKKQEPSVDEKQLAEKALEILERGRESYHMLLGIDEEATDEEIRRAYFNLVDRFHPDRYYGSVSSDNQKLLENLFRSLTQAYESLTM